MNGGTGRQWWRLLLPWGAAAFLFTPRYRLLPEDRVMSRIGQARAIAGLVMTIGIAVYYGAFSDFGLEPLLQSLAATGLLAVPSMLICMATVVVATRGGRRGAVVRQLRWPALTLGLFVAIMGAVLLFNAGAGTLSRFDDRIPLNGFIYGGVFSLWFLVFAFRGAYLVSQYWFNAVDGHPYLQPLMAVWMAWVLAVNTLVFQAEDGTDGVPSVVSRALPVLAALLTTGLALAEAARVRIALQPAPNYWPQPGAPAPDGHHRAPTEPR